MRRWIILMLFAMLPAGLLHAQETSNDGLPRALRGVGFDQRLDAQVPLDTKFLDEAGKAVHLGDYFDDKPVILVLAYYRCPKLCNEVLNGLLWAMKDLSFDVGKEYRVVTVSFDPDEKPALADAKRKSYLERYGRPGAADGWHFLTGDQDSIHRLTNAVGFRYVWDDNGKQFAHASGIMILTPRGRIARYFYDIRYAPFDLRLSLVEASANRIGSPVDQVLLYCFHYDPEQGKYGPAVMRLVRLGGIVTMLTVGTLIGVMLRRERRKAKEAALPAQGTC